MKTVARITLLVIIVSMMYVQPAWAGWGTVATQGQGCEDLEAYQQAIVFAIEDEDDLDAITVVMESDLEELRRSEMLEGAAAFERWAENVEGIDDEDIPEVARDHRDVTVRWMTLMSNVLYAMANGGPIAVLPYTDVIDELAIDVQLVQDNGVRACGSQWEEVFGESEEDENSI